MTQNTAIKRANSLIKKLGQGWTARVWENLGWHYAVENGTLTVYPIHQTSKLGYYCMLTDDTNFLGCGSVLWTDSKIFKCPKQAIAHTVKLAETEINKLTNILKIAKAEVYQLQRR